MGSGQRIFPKEEKVKLSDYSNKEFFKKGDKVRCIDSGRKGLGWENGKEFEISYIKDKVAFLAGDNGVFLNSLEKVEKKRDYSKEWYRFVQKGDILRCIKNSLFSFDKGEEFKVEDIKVEHGEYKFKKVDSAFAFQDHFEPVKLRAGVIEDKPKNSVRGEKLDWLIIDDLDAGDSKDALELQKKHLYESGFLPPEVLKDEKLEHHNCRCETNNHSNNNKNTKEDGRSKSNKRKFERGSIPIGEICEVRRHRWKPRRD